MYPQPHIAALRSEFGRFRVKTSVFNIVFLTLISSAEDFIGFKKVCVSLYLKDMCVFGRYIDEELICCRKNLRKYDCDIFVPNYSG